MGKWHEAKALEEVPRGVLGAVGGRAQGPVTLQINNGRIRHKALAKLAQ